MVKDELPAGNVDDPLGHPAGETLKINETTSDVAAQTIPEIFGRYQLERELGQGGMGTVYLAADPVLDRRVALKVMTLEGIEATGRFMREVRASAKLKHPHIVQIYEVGTQGKFHFFTMEYVDGGNLEELIKDGKVTAKRVAEIISGIASALQYAHEQGIIHRDIKPSNILIDRQGQPYLTDFGLAKELAGLERSLTMTGTIMGTPDYMSPEQARGEKDKIDARSDIFSLGAALYYSLTGQSPFKDSDLYQVLNRVINKDPLPPTRMAQNLHRDLETICMKCLEKEPARRYQTVQELAEDLRRFLEGENIQARRSGLITKLIKKARRNKPAAWAILGTTAALLSVISYLLVSASLTDARINQYRRNARNSFNNNNYEATAVWCNKVLTLLPDEPDIKELLNTCAQYKKRRAMAEKIFETVKLGEISTDDKIKIAERALEIDPTFTEALDALGSIYAQKKDYVKALLISNRMLEIKPDDYKYYYTRGSVKEQLKDFEGAIADFTRAVELKPDYWSAYYQRADVYGEIKNYEPAIADYTKVIALKPDYYDAYLERGYAHNMKGDYAKALIDYNKAIELKPDYAKAYSWRVNVHTKNADLPLALADCTKAIELDPAYSGYYGQRARVYKDYGKLEEALADYNKAIELDPDEAVYYELRGSIYYKKGDLKKALADFTKEIELQPNNVAGYIGLGETYYRMGDFDRTITAWTKVLKLSPGYTAGYYQRGYAYWAKNDLGRALADFNRFIELNQRDANSYKYRGDIYSQLGNYPAALADYSRAIKLNPKDDVAYNSRGTIYNGMDKNDLAIKDFTKALEIAPDNPAVYCNRALTYNVQGAYNKAISDCNRAIELNPDYGAAYRHRGAANYYLG